MKDNNTKIYFNKVLSTLSNRFDILKFCQMYEYITILTKLSEKGYNLATQDKELVFIDIITKNIPEEISLLESYLEVFDLVQTDIALFNKFDKLYQDLENSSNKQEIATYFVNNYS